MYEMYPHSGYWLYTPEEIKKLPTRQLLKHYRDMYRWWHGEEDWDPFAQKHWTQHKGYKKLLKKELDTREHIPNKNESKAIRKARKKKGN